MVKASLLRLTLHAAHAEDYPSFHSAMLPSLRASRLHDRRFAESGLATADVDGYITGVWRAIEGGIEAATFRRLNEETWTGLADEAGALLEFITDREPDVYRRYTRWWEELPTEEVRRCWPGATT